jgi:hypothetical protein
MTSAINISLEFMSLEIAKKATLWRSKQELTLLLNFDTYTEEDFLLQLYDAIGQTG